MKSNFLYLGCRDDPTVDKVAQKEYLKLIGLPEADFDEYDDNYRGNVDGFLFLQSIVIWQLFWKGASDDALQINNN